MDCETYMSSIQQMGNPPKTVHVLHSVSTFKGDEFRDLVYINFFFVFQSEHPASVFSILDTGTKQIPLVADGLFDLLMLKMTPHYTSKKQTKTESKGPRFELGDFLIKLGSVTMSQSFKGILVEVEYRPCILPVSCWELMREFLQGFLGNCVPNTIPSYFTNHNRVNEIYQPLDTIQQYLEHFTNYRKQTTPAVGMRQ